MAKLPIKPVKIFGSNLSPTGNVAVFGSLAAGAPAYSIDPLVIQSLAAWLNGFAASLTNTSGGQSSPNLEDFNGLMLVLSYHLAYLRQAGLAEWDPTANYQTYSWCQVDGVPYVSKTDDNLNNNPTAGNTYWQTFASTLALTECLLPAPIAISPLGSPLAVQAGNLVGTADPNFASVYNKVNEIIALLKNFPIPIAQ